jgi:hypothetical protein
MALRSADCRSFADMVMDCAFLVVSASASHLSLLLLVSDCASAYGRVALAFRHENADTIVLHCLSPSQVTLAQSASTRVFLNTLRQYSMLRTVQKFSNSMEASIFCARSSRMLDMTE